MKPFAHTLAAACSYVITAYGHSSGCGQELQTGQHLLLVACRSSSPNHASLHLVLGTQASARQREAALQAQLSGVRREFGSRQRLVMKVLASRAGEVGTQGAETRQLLAALDYSGYFQGLES